MQQNINQISFKKLEMWFH